MDGKRPETEEAAEVNKSIAEMMRNIRKRKGLTQVEISNLSGVSVGSVKRFEKTGNISLTSFSKIVIALGLEVELLKLFHDVRMRIH